MEILGSGQMMKSRGSKYIVLSIMHFQGLVFVLGGPTPGFPKGKEHCFNFETNLGGQALGNSRQMSCRRFSTT